MEVQTFLPFSSFAHSVEVLDYKRLGKQRTECLQLFNALMTQSGWSNHPVAKMWRGYESALALYMSFVIWEWEDRGYQNNMITPYTRDRQVNPAFKYAELLLPFEQIEAPPWLGRQDFHAAMRGNLIRKDEEHYRMYFDGDPELKYIYPQPREQQ